MARWTALLLFASVSLTTLVSNWFVVLNWISGRKRASLIPLIGGFLGLVALLVSPNPVLRRWWWVGLVLDPGCLPMVLGAAWRELNGKRH